MVLPTEIQMDHQQALAQFGFPFFLIAFGKAYLEQLEITKFPLQYEMLALRYQ